MPKKCVIPTTELAMRAILHVQAMRASMLIGDVADTLREKFGLSRAHAYRTTALALDVLGRQARPRPMGAWKHSHGPLSAQHKARIAEGMRRRWKDPAYVDMQGRLRKKQLVLRGSRANR